MNPPSIIRIAVPRREPSAPPPHRIPAREVLKLAARLDSLLAQLPANEPAELAGVALRVLAALPRRKAVRACDLVQSLGLDAGHLSRVLGRLEHHGMIERNIAADRRQSAITLAAFGRFTLRRNQQRREGALADLIDALPQSNQSRLADAMARSDEILAKLD